MTIATNLGWHTGSRSDDTIYPAHRPLFFLDVAWHDYDWSHHLAVVRAEQPALAAVPDILTPAGLPLALAQAEELASHCASLCIIPKCRVIQLLPRCIGGTPVMLGYSVPTKYGASPLPLWEYAGWPVHLLGGTPRRQLDVAGYMNVVSADGNMAQKLAHRGIVITARGGREMLAATDPDIQGAAMPARALARSLANIAALWTGAGYTLERRQEIVKDNHQYTAQDIG